MARGTVEYSSAGKPPTLYSETEQPLPLEATDGYAAEIGYFAECCRAGRRPDRCPPEESAEAVDLMHALLTAREGWSCFAERPMFFATLLDRDRPPRHVDPMNSGDQLFLRRRRAVHDHFCSPPIREDSSMSVRAAARRIPRLLR